MNTLTKKDMEMINITIPKDPTKVSIKTSNGVCVLDELLKLGIHVQEINLNYSAGGVPQVCFYVYLDSGISVDIDRSILKVETIINNRDEIKQPDDIPKMSSLEKFFDPSKGLRIR